MSTKPTSQLPMPQANAPATGHRTDTGETCPLAAAPAPTLTMSRGTRPLSAWRPAHGNLHADRRHSA